MLICSLQLQPSVNTPHLVSTAVTSLLGQEYTDEFIHWVELILNVDM